MWKFSLWRLIIQATYWAYIVKTLGPMIDPWGTPQIRSNLSNITPLTGTRNWRPVIYEWNHYRAVPLIPKPWPRQWSRITWSMVSKAAERSSIIRKAALSWSRVWAISFFYLEQRSFSIMLIFVSSSWAWFFSLFFSRKFHIELCHSRPITYLQHLKKLQFSYMISINYILTSK